MHDIFNKTQTYLYTGDDWIILQNIVLSKPNFFANTEGEV